MSANDPRILQLPICGVPRRRHGDAPCKQTAGERTPHPGYGPCWLHGGNLPGVITHHKREAVKREVAIYAEKVIMEPAANALLEQGRTEGAIEYLLERLNGIPDEQVPGSPYTAVAQWERKHLVHTADTLIRARTVAVLEEQEAIQTQLLLEAMRRVLEQYVPPSQLNAAAVSLRRELDRLVQRWREVTGAVDVQVPRPGYAPTMITPGGSK